MCGVAIASLVVGIVSAVGSAYQQDDQQRKTIRYQNRVTEVTQANAAKAARSDYIATAERASQIRAAASQENFDARRAAEAAKGQLAVGAAAAGLEGGSVEDLRLTIAQKAAEDTALRSTNLDWQEAQIQRSLEKIEVGEQNRANQLNLPPIPGVNYAQLLGSLGAAGTNYDIARRA
jgi:hypothetical protein